MNTGNHRWNQTMPYCTGINTQPASSRFCLIWNDSISAQHAHLLFTFSFFLCSYIKSTAYWDTHQFILMTHTTHVTIRHSRQALTRYLTLCSGCRPMSYFSHQSSAVNLLNRCIQFLSSLLPWMLKRRQHYVLTSKRTSPWISYSFRCRHMFHSIEFPQIPQK